MQLIWGAKLISKRMNRGARIEWDWFPSSLWKPRNGNESSKGRATQSWPTTMWSWILLNQSTNDNPIFPLTYVKRITIYDGAHTQTYLSLDGMSPTHPYTMQKTSKKHVLLKVRQDGMHKADTSQNLNQTRKHRNFLSRKLVVLFYPRVLPRLWALITCLSRLIHDSVVEICARTILNLQA